MNIDEHPIYRAIYELCREIEALPASEQQTKVVVMASALHEPASRLVAALKDAVNAFNEKPTTVTDERIEAWRAAL